VRNTFEPRWVRSRYTRRAHSRDCGGAVQLVASCSAGQSVRVQCQYGEQFGIRVTADLAAVEPGDGRSAPGNSVQQGLRDRSCSEIRSRNPSATVEDSHAVMSSRSDQAQAV